MRPSGLGPLIVAASSNVGPTARVEVEGAGRSGGFLDSRKGGRDCSRFEPSRRVHRVHRGRERKLLSGDGKTEFIYKIKLWNKPQALELLGRHQGIFREDQPSDAPDVPAFTLPPDTPGVRVH